MAVRRRTRVYGWRWRRNPLRRRSDVVEAWTLLVAAMVWQHTAAVGVCATGVTAGAVLLARTAVRRKVIRRRLVEWERAWAATEPEWTRRRA